MARRPSFAEEVRELGRALRAQEGAADLAHLARVRWATRALGALGLATVAAEPNPLTVMALSMYTFAQWTMLAHHTSHGGYERLDGRSRRRHGTGGVCARVRDWMDWMLPEAWDLEHNRLHHYSLNEQGKDPDLVEYNLRPLRESGTPLPLKYLQVATMAMTWKWAYYAPNTYKALRTVGVDDPCGGRPLLIWDAFPPPLSRREFLLRVVGPYAAARFALVPAAAWLAGFDPGNALANMGLAEVLTNLHSFAIIVPSHCGADLCRFEGAVGAGTAAFYERQVRGSANYPTGDRWGPTADLVDFAHGWLNYQIEHHLWPDLSMLSYRRAAPLLRSLCRKHGLPYTQHSVAWRLRMTVRVMVGADRMRRWPPLGGRRGTVPGPHPGVDGGGGPAR